MPFLIILIKRSRLKMYQNVISPQGTARAIAIAGLDLIASFLEISRRRFVSSCLGVRGLACAGTVKFLGAGQDFLLEANLVYLLHVKVMKPEF